MVPNENEVETREFPSTMVTFGLIWRGGLNWVTFLIYWILSSAVIWAVEKDEESWHTNYEAYLHMVATVFTTVGYGTVYPTTRWSKLITIILIFTIIPLFLHCLATTANLLNGLLDRLVGARATVVEKSGDKENYLRPGKRPSVKHILLGAAIVAGLMLFHLFLSAGIHFVTEMDLPDSPFQTFGDSLWFEFVTYSTIGFGDMVPMSVFSISGAFFGTIFFNIFSCILLITLITRVWILIQ